MDQYIDEIKICAQKLSAVGYMVDDEDMIFHTLNGLPTEFDPIKSAIGAQRDLKFHELVSILKSEESRIHKSKGVTDSTSVFVATQKLQGDKSKQNHKSTFPGSRVEYSYKLTIKKITFPGSRQNHSFRITPSN
ncbi:hypothetical protein RHGRI_005275 [Rhododendron griersonianum]|uniref:Uncharacterized protein n=1 Tax=Rhododendron griersonianum TaxID=479676 RepID=A0AAV6LEG2_9ERIC|nr:hypothetical protein RHGRI_005275 [Rhododendron griersonianum]